MVLAYDIESFLSTIADLDNMKSFIILFAMSSYVFFCCLYELSGISKPRKSSY